MGIMLNKVIIMGRITKDIEVKQTPQGIAVTSFTVAVERNYQRQGEERQRDFITCVAWRQTADFIGRYFGKGRMIALTGNLRTRTYDDKNGVKHYVTEVHVEEASFTGEPKQQGNYQQNYNENQYAPQGQQGNYQQGSYNQNSNGGYQQNGGYQNQPAPQGNYQQGGYPPAPNEDPINIGDFADFEQFSDEGVPF